MTYAKPDFSDAEAGDKVYYRGLDEWLEGVVIQNGDGRIDIGFGGGEGSHYWSVTANHDGTIGHSNTPELYWTPPPDPPRECLQSPRKMAARD